MEMENMVTPLLAELQEHPVIQRSILIACMHTPDIPSCADVSRWKGESDRV